VPRLHPLPPPEVEALERLPIHVLIRDWPELMAVLAAGGVDPVTEGGISLSARAPDAPRPIPRRLLEVTAWREVQRFAADPATEG
jgi:hypothetical protein